jgi:hypothetical protein
MKFYAKQKDLVKGIKLRLMKYFYILFVIINIMLFL